MIKTIKYICFLRNISITEVDSNYQSRYQLQFTFVAKSLHKYIFIRREITLYAYFPFNLFLYILLK
jgi:hypothetical protein